jgi:diaminopimelate decarboxylase
MLPELELGDYLIHTDMGAYSVAVSSGTESFNGFKRTMNMYVIN